MSVGLDGLLGELDPLEAARWAALQEGRIAFQRCAPCGHAWLPPRSRCPRCLSDDWGWESAEGSAELVSWAVYHIALHPALERLLPYTVALVELAEGPRMISRLRDHPGAATPRCGASVRLETVAFEAVTLAEAILVQ